jgi:hypothetical protein
MKKFTFSDLNNASGEILDAAMIEPVALTQQGEDRLVMLSIDTYRLLIGNRPREAYTLGEAPQSIIDELATGLQLLADPSSDLRRNAMSTPVKDVFAATMTQDMIEASDRRTIELLEEQRLKSRHRTALMRSRKNSKITSD